MSYGSVVLLGSFIGVLNLLFMCLIQKKEGLAIFTKTIWYKQKMVWFLLVGMCIVSSYLFWLSSGFTEEYIVKLCLISYLVPLCLYDIRYQLLPDILHIIYFFLFFCIKFFIGSWYHLIDGAVGLLVLFFICSFIYLLKKDQFGFGDMKVLCVCAFLTGIPDIFYFVFRATLIAAVVGVVKLLLHKAQLKTELPFIPFLLIGTLV